MERAAMNHLLRNFWAVVIAGLIVSSVAKADAQPANEQVLVVAVSKGHGSDSRLVKGLGEHLQQSGMLLAEETLSAQDRACESSECIESLANRTNSQLVLTAQLQENAPNTVFITMALFDAVRRAPFQATALCDQCNHEALIGKLSDVADKLIKQSREARQNPIRSTQPPIVPVVPLVSGDPGIGSNHGGSNSGQFPKIEQGFFAKLSPRRRVIAGVLGGLAGAALITSIALTATDKQYTSLPCEAMNSAGKCRLDNVGLYATGYALTGALAIGIGVTLFWPADTAKAQEVK